MDQRPAVFLRLTGLATLRDKKIVLVIESLLRGHITRGPGSTVGAGGEEAIIVRANAGLGNRGESLGGGERFGPVEIGLGARIAQRNHAVGW